MEDVVLISVVTEKWFSYSHAYIYIHTHTFFFIMVYHRVVNTVPYATQ